MGHFGNVVRRGLGYPATLAGVVISSLAIALLWGGNIGTVYPLIEVAFNGQSIRQWIDGKIETAEATTAKLEAAMAASSQQERATIAGRLAAEERALTWYRKAAPYIHRLPANTPFGSLVLIIGFLLVGTLLKNIFLGANLVLVERLAQSVALGLRREFFQRTLALDLGTLGQEPTSDLMARFTHDMNFVAAALMSLYGRSVREPLKMVVCLIGAAMISWRLLLISLIAAPLAGLVITLLARSIKRASRRAMEEMNGMYAMLAEVLGGIDVVKAYTMERYELRRFEQTSRRYMRRVMRIVAYNALLRPATELMGIGAIAAGILAGGYLVLNQQTSLFGIPITDRRLDNGALMTFFALLVGASDPARKLSDVYGAIQRGVAACERVFDRMQRQPKIVESKTARPVPKPIGGIEFQDVSFHYVPGQPVLENLSLTIQPDETIAFVGPNGCGKSTLVNLIPRFYDPTSGVVQIAGVDVRQLALRDLRRRIALVTQRTVLFDETILDNMRYGAPRASLDEVMQAAKQAHIHEFIMQLPQGYDSPVGQGGNRLSGGQRQRIALTRAILRQPEILVLDEATSQIDPESEQAIHETLQAFTHGRITLMVTHRAASLQLADQVVVMDQGRIVAHGPPAELHNSCPLFRRLFPSLPNPKQQPRERQSA